MKHSCKIKKEKDEEKDKIFERLVKMEEENKASKDEIAKLKKDSSAKIAKLEKELASVKKKVKDVKKAGAGTVNNRDVNNGTIGNVNNGTINNNIQNIILVGYGNEDISKIDTAEILKVMKNGYSSTIKLTEAVHFNPKHPEYHNIYISNMKDKYAMMFDGKDWTLTTKEELINKIYDDKKNYIEENWENFVASLTLSRKRALERWLDTEDEDAKITEIKEQIKMLLYNKRKIPLETIELKRKVEPQVKKLTMTKASRKAVKDD